MLAGAHPPPADQLVVVPFWDVNITCSPSFEQCVAQSRALLSTPVVFQHKGESVHIVQSGGAPPAGTSNLASTTGWAREVSSSCDTRHMPRWLHAGGPVGIFFSDCHLDGAPTAACYPDNVPGELLGRVRHALQLRQRLAERLGVPVWITLVHSSALDVTTNKHAGQALPAGTPSPTWQLEAVAPVNHTDFPLTAVADVYGRVAPFRSASGAALVPASTYLVGGVSPTWAWHGNLLGDMCMSGMPWLQVGVC